MGGSGPVRLPDGKKGSSTFPGAIRKTSNLSGPKSSRKTWPVRVTTTSPGSDSPGIVPSKAHLHSLALACGFLVKRGSRKRPGDPLDNAAERCSARSAGKRTAPDPGANGVTWRETAPTFVRTDFGS
jgi:hypothetical protein